MAARRGKNQARRNGRNGSRPAWIWVVAGLAIREGIEAWRGDIESPFEVLEDLDHDDHEEVTP